MRSRVEGPDVDAPAGAILVDVLKVLDDLQRRADPVRQRDPLGRRLAEDVQDELTDGRRRELAVVEQLLDRVVAG